jgi:hypothetical protein
VIADYGSAAAALYDPQQAADMAVLTDTLNKTNQSLDTATTTTETNYKNTNEDYGKQRGTDTAQSRFNASTHGLYGSGLAANQDNQIYSDYTTNVDRLNTDRQQKLADIAGQRSLAQTSFNNESGALSTKYGALKSDYINSHLQADAQIAAQQAAQARAYSSGGSGYSSAASGGSSSSGGGAANYNSTQIMGLIHSIRNDPSTFHASWGSIASMLAKQGINTAHGSQADLALRKYFGQ